MPQENPDKTRPVPPSSRGIGMGIVILAAAIGAVLSAMLIWLNDLPALWAILFYPAIGCVLTFLFAALRIKRRAQSPMPRS